jgi:prepilin-type N-terminal cleavage/methylation domain-containing protein
MRNQRGFTLIELLVVIAIIAILGAMIRVSISAANDRANIAVCESRLEQINLAVRQYVEDHGRAPARLDDLMRERYLLDADVLQCVKTGHQFHYRAVAPEGPSRQVIASCVAPGTPKRRRPHGQGDASVTLRLDGKVAVGR